MRDYVLMLNPWGAAVILWLQSMACPLLDGLARAITYLGDGYYVLLALLLYWCRDRSRAMRLVALFVVSLALNGALKAWVQSPRPFVAFSEVVGKVPAQGSAFPSGHAQIAAAFAAGAVWLYRRGWVTALAVVGALSVAWSRVWLGVHYPHDVAAGLLVGVATTLAWAGAERRLRRKGFKLGAGAVLMGSAVLAAAVAIMVDSRYAHLAAGGWWGFAVGYVVCTRIVADTIADQRACVFRAGVGLAIAAAAALALTQLEALPQALRASPAGGFLAAWLVGGLLALLPVWPAPWAWLGGRSTSETG